MELEIKSNPYKDFSYLIQNMNQKNNLNLTYFNKNLLEYNNLNDKLDNNSLDNKSINNIYNDYDNTSKDSSL